MTKHKITDSSDKSAALLTSEVVAESVKDLSEVDWSLVSDGSHTFDELYFHRMVLFSIVCYTYKDKAWKSLLHEDGTMFDGYFIVGITTPEGHYSYHYKLEYWDKFDIKEVEFAPKYDGHQPSDIERLYSLL